jgi:hypothetical protein
MHYEVVHLLLNFVNTLLQCRLTFDLQLVGYFNFLRYSREEAAFPLPWIKERGKYWPACRRVDNAYGDRNIKVKLTE